MSITVTTLASAVASTDTVINVASATGISTPNFTSGLNIVYLLVDQEFMVPVSVTGTFVTVLRGQNGTAATAHVINGQVQIGLPTDYATYAEFLKASITGVQTEGALVWPAIFLAGTADAIPSTVPGFYVVKSASANAMTLAAPTAAQEGNIIQIWSDTLFAHTLTATSLLANGTALKTTATFPAFRGAGLILRACNLVYHVLSNGASAGIVVLT